MRGRTAHERERGGEDHELCCMKRARGPWYCRQCSTAVCLPVASWGGCCTVHDVVQLYHVMAGNLKSIIMILTYPSTNTYPSCPIAVQSFSRPSLRVRIKAKKRAKLEATGQSPSDQSDTPPLPPDDSDIDAVLFEKRVMFRTSR